MSRAVCRIVAPALFAAATAWAGSPNDIVAQDLAQRSPEIHWPADFVPPAADTFSHNEVLIQARCDQVWHVLLNASAPGKAIANPGHLLRHRGRRSHRENLCLDVLSAQRFGVF
jgi:hypothetical protein